MGFAENNGPCADESIKTIENYGISTCSTRLELGKNRTIDNESKDHFYFIGTQRYHIELEETLADFLGVESCIAFGMVNRKFQRLKNLFSYKKNLIRVLQRMH